jgi:hypothetical protein
VTPSDVSIFKVTKFRPGQVTITLAETILSISPLRFPGPKAVLALLSGTAIKPMKPQRFCQSRRAFAGH